MTIPEFIEKLKQTPRDWYLNDCSGIRRGSPSESQCPLSFFVNSDCSHWYSAGDALGLSIRDRRTIINAADAAPGGATHEERVQIGHVRAQLLSACGLEETHGSQ
jgi:hypothetical protein